MDADLKLKLAEQHRNTRHDAVEKVLEIREQWQKMGYDFSVADKILDQISGAIMNLKQREVS